MIWGDHNQPPILPGEITTVLHRVLAQGYVTYAFDNETASYPNFRADAARVVEADRIAVGVPAHDVQSAPDMWLTMPDDATFIRICGSGAAACIQYWADPVIVYFRKALLYRSFDTAIGHEGINAGHAFGEHEQYDDRNFKCLTDRTWTVMSCGTGVWAAQFPFDVFTIWNLLVPDAPSFHSLDVSPGWATVHWNLFRADGGQAHFDNPKLDNVTRVSFGHSACDGCPIQWAGDVCGQALNYCYSNPNDLSRGFDTFWKGCLFIRMESAAFWFVPQISAPDFWTLAGCW